jgi:Rieske Fe-S protein
MPLDEDKYPTESGRRRFVKGVVGSAALSGVATGGTAAVNMATSAAGAGGGITQYIAIENTAGPAPRGMPMIPLEINSAGEIKGVWPEVQTVERQGRQIQIAEQDVGGVTYSSAWFQYCGVQTYAGTEPGADLDNFFRATPAPAAFEWQQDVEPGTKLTIDMFDDYETWGNGIGRSGLGKPAAGSWRSQGDGVQTMPIQVLRTPELPKMINGEGKYSEIPPGVRDFLDAATAQNTMAWLDKCTHFCCVPHFKAFEGSSKFGGEDAVYCQCHQSVYDPFSPVQKTFTALPRPSE